MALSQRPVRSPGMILLTVANARMRILAQSATYSTGHVAGSRNRRLGSDGATTHEFIDMISYIVRRRFRQLWGSAATTVRSVTGIAIVTLATLVLGIPDAGAQAVAPVGSTADDGAISRSIAMNL